ncbi:short-chain dehydrogenases/reductase [Irpex rosettiformis]|uniref:Short-chain dehydrogenases/reductase n=1 Tax=Irpex rosettiformis TaxID=378272 RepID=A0ACB8U2F2_9APHY|nr:short-chain dehydrogenases/reductase [Irpex rosettiformis]
MPSYVVTGSSRGLGLGFVRAISSDPEKTVFAVIRSKSSASLLLDFIVKHPHNNVHVIEADNNDANALQNAAATVSEITGGTSNPEILENNLILYFRTNAVGPINTINAFLPLLRAGTTKKCLTISSSLGSPRFTNANDFSTFPSYGMSKAALNLAMAKYASRFRDEGLVFLTISPGLVKTMIGTKEEVDAAYAIFDRMSRKNDPDFEGPITIEQSANDILALLDKATVANSGTFVHRDGRDADYF